MFDVDQFLADCREARDEASPHRAIREVLDRALDEPDEIAEALAPTEGGITLLRHEPDLTVVHVVWAPGMRLFPHDHRMWAAIAIYAGQEDNAFYRRAGDDRSRLNDAGGIAVRTGDVLMLGDDVIHAVSNTTRKLTGAIHVYGGDFVNQPRSQWGPGPVEERPYDMSEAERQFVEANQAWRASS
jgi:predicted metal-dependent enzyme (double-stranded beta helix superfamily)